MKRQTKRLLDLDQEILLRALENERIRMVDDVKSKLTDLVKDLTAKNAVSVLGGILDLAVEEQANVGHTRDAIEELEKNMGVFNRASNRAYIDSIPHVDTEPLTEEELKQFKTNPLFEIRDDDIPF